MKFLKKLYEGLFGCAVTVALFVTLLMGRQLGGLRGMMTGFVASVGILGALWITLSPEPSTKTFRIIGLLTAVMCGIGVSLGGWRSGWCYGLVGWFLGMAIYFVLTRLTKFS